MLLASACVQKCWFKNADLKIKLFYFILFYSSRTTGIFCLYINYLIIKIITNLTGVDAKSLEVEDFLIGIFFNFYILRLDEGSGIKVVPYFSGTVVTLRAMLN